MKRVVQSTILTLFGLALLKLAISADLLLYVRPVARPWVGLAGGALTVLGLVGVIGAVRQEGDDGPSIVWPTSADDGHGHSQTTRAMWLVLAPVVAVLVIQPPALGVFTADRAPLNPATVTGRPGTLTRSADPVPVSVFQFVLLASARPAALRDQPVQLTGFVLARHSGGFTLARLVIICCAADASTAKVEVSAPGPAPAPGTWVDVDGRFTSAPAPDGPPGLAATSVRVIDQPRNPYDH